MRGTLKRLPAGPPAKPRSAGHLRGRTAHEPTAQGQYTQVTTSDHSGSPGQIAAPGEPSAHAERSEVLAGSEHHSETLTREAGEKPAKLGESVAVEPLLGVLRGGRGKQVLRAERTGLDGVLSPHGTGSQRPAADTYVTAHGQGLHRVGWGAVAERKKRGGERRGCSFLAERLLTGLPFTSLCSGAHLK